MALNDHDKGAISDPGRDPVLDRLYAESAREEPPARVDAAIRAAARRAVGARPRSLGSIVRAWRVPVSVAAILVLSASLVVLMKEEGADRFYEAPPSAVPQPDSAEVARTDAPRPQARSEAQGAPEKRAFEPAPPAERGGPARAKQAASGARNDQPRQRETAPSLPQALPPAPPRTFEERQTAERRAAQPQESAAAGKETDTGSAGAGRLSDRPVTLAAPAAPTKPSPHSDAVAKRFEAESGQRGSLEQSARSAPEAVAKAAPPPLTRAAPLAAESGSAASALRAPVWSGYERQPPDKWVAYIEELRRAGREAEAREMLEELRKRFPDYPLPTSLGR